MKCLQKKYLNKNIEMHFFIVFLVVCVCAPYQDRWEMGKTKTRLRQSHLSDLRRRGKDKPECLAKVKKYETLKNI